MKISCIIPAYNEGKRIRKVLEVVIGHPLIFEIIVVDDASLDDTGKIVSEYKNVRLITHKVNLGKTKALRTGILESSGDFLFFLDSDLIGLTAEDITKLIDPVESNSAEVSISLRRNAPGLWHMIGIDYISGERVLPKGILLPYLDRMLTLPKFGIEVFMNSLIIKSNLRIAIVPWENVDSPYPNVKMGFWKGTKYFLLMLLDIFRTISFFGPVYQIIKMKKLIVKL